MRRASLRTTTCSQRSTHSGSSSFARRTAISSARCHASSASGPAPRWRAAAIMRGPSVRAMRAGSTPRGGRSPTGTAPAVASPCPTRGRKEAGQRGRRPRNRSWSWRAPRGARLQERRATG
jgi:hypothetical protein